MSTSVAPPVILIAPQTTAAAPESGGLQSSLSESYAAAIRAAGGTPLILSCLVDDQYVAHVMGLADGILLTGGDDVNPQLYAPDMAKRLRATLTLDGPERDAFELLVIREAFRRRIPLMAICRGMQILNVALGGTLIADIPSEVPQPTINHRRNDAKASIVHDIHISPGSLFASAVGCLKMGVNSTHHQAVGKVAKVLQPSAVSRDGIVEGMELGSAHMDVLPYLLAVQFHPERLWARYHEHLELFRSFTAACHRNRQ